MDKKKAQNTKGKAIHDLFREIFELYSVLSKIMDKVHEYAGITTSLLKIMRTLDNIEPATVPDIATALGVSRQFVQAGCNELLSKGFIQFRDNPRHKRSKLALLTESGRIHFRKARNKENSVIEKALPEIESIRAKEAYDLLRYIRMALNEESVLSNIGENSD